MYIVHIASELATVAKVGGLADVVFGLSRELELRGHAVESALPRYDCMRFDQVWGLHVANEDLSVRWDGGAIRCTVWVGFGHGRGCFFVQPHSQQAFFDRGTYYGFWDDAQRFAFFSKAALEFLLKSDKRPAVIHTHDWQTALVPVLLYEIYAPAGLAEQRLCHTIHNLAHQGVTGPHILAATGLHRPEYYGDPDRMGDGIDHHAINLTKGGIVYANFVTTVSPHHACPGAPGSRRAAPLLIGKVVYVLIDRMSYHYADWVYRKYGLEEYLTDDYYYRTKQALATL